MSIVLRLWMVDATPYHIILFWILYFQDKPTNQRNGNNDQIMDHDHEAIKKNAIAIKIVIEAFYKITILLLLLLSLYIRHSFIHNNNKPHHRTFYV